MRQWQTTEEMRKYFGILAYNVIVMEKRGAIGLCLGKAMRMQGNDKVWKRNITVEVTFSS